MFHKFLFKGNQESNGQGSGLWGKCGECSCRYSLILFKRVFIIYTSYFFVRSWLTKVLKAVEKCNNR